jgi:hypothetical protein
VEVQVASLELEHCLASRVLAPFKYLETKLKLARPVIDESAS